MPAGSVAAPPARSGGHYSHSGGRPLKRQLALLDLLARTSRAGAQSVIATHSPILLACPGARIFSFDQIPISRVGYGDLEHVVITRDFLNDPGRFIRR